MVQQVQVKNGVMEAQYGGAMGGVVNAVVRSGTNEFHGQAGFYFNNDTMSARPRPTLRASTLTDDTRSRDGTSRTRWTTFQPGTRCSTSAVRS